MQLIHEDPFINTERLTNQKGKRKIRIHKSKYRIILCIPKECQELGFDKVNSCVDYVSTDLIIRGIMGRKRNYKRDVK